MASDTMALPDCQIVCASPKMCVPQATALPEMVHMGGQTGSVLAEALVCWLWDMCSSGTWQGLTNSCDAWSFCSPLILGPSLSVSHERRL